MDAGKLVKAAATAALASTGDLVHQQCPSWVQAKYHLPDVCETKPVHRYGGHVSRRSIFRSLQQSGVGASLVPNIETVTCPLGEVQSLESPSAAMGFDTTWIVENTSTKSVVLARVTNGIEYSPFQPDKKPMEDPQAILKPGEWISVPTFESFVYHAREIDGDGNAGNVVLQHRAGLIPIGKGFSCGSDDKIDPEPFDPNTVATEVKPIPQEEEALREPPKHRPCNSIEMGFRNEAGCPLSVYWANKVVDIPDLGRRCTEKYKFHMGTNPAPQDFMHDWGSATKFEGSLVGHTFVARLADNPSILVDQYTVESTRIIDCPTTKKQQVVMVPPSASEEVVESVEEVDRTTTSDPSSNTLIDAENVLDDGGSSVGVAAGVCSRSI